MGDCPDDYVGDCPDDYVGKYLGDHNTQTGRYGETNHVFSLVLGVQIRE